MGGADLPSLTDCATFLQHGKEQVLDLCARGRHQSSSLTPVHPVSRSLVLCIDDNAAILSYEKAFLERSGYSVITADSALQGLRLLTMYEFDAVLLDYSMPDMNGGDVAFEIKRVRPELAVILLSGSDVPTHALAWVDAFIHKPDASRELLPAIAGLCGRIRKPQPKRDELQP